MKIRRQYFKVCGRCGGTLDPGERCECEIALDRLRRDPQIIRLHDGKEEQRKRPVPAV